MNYRTNFSLRNTVTPQSEPIPGEDQVKNNAGGFVYALDKWKQLERWLILGSAEPTYYASARNLTKDNAQIVIDCAKEDAGRLVDAIVDVSDKGRAPKNSPALYALAIAASLSDDAGRRRAFSALPKVARIGTHLFEFVEYAEGFRGWGRGMRRAVKAWYQDKSPETVGYQLIKYKQRDGWSHRDLLRLAKKPDGDAHAALFDYVCRGIVSDTLPLQVRVASELAGMAVDDVCRAIVEHRLPREVVPTELLGDVKVWDALLANMPMHAMVRNLGKMSAVGLLKPLSDAETHVVAALSDGEAVRKSRLHPLAILMAMGVYARGHGEKGSLSWNVSQQAVAALDKAFYLGFSNVEPTGKRILLGLDVSGSMGSGSVAGSGLTPREVSVAMALVTMATEKRTHLFGFSDVFKPLNMIQPGMRLNDAVNAVRGLTFGGTDCSLPMIYAMQNKMEVDAFIVLTDNETWAGGMHPVEALRQYRKQSGIDAKLVVVGLTATGFSIADPKDAGMMDIVGMDASAPALIADFVRGAV